MRRNGFACSPGRACPGLISPRSSRSSTCSSPIWTCSCCARWLRRIAAAAGARIRSGRNGNGASSPITQRAPLAAVPKPRNVVAPATRCPRPVRPCGAPSPGQRAAGRLGGGTRLLLEQCLPQVARRDPDVLAGREQFGFGEPLADVLLAGLQLRRALDDALERLPADELARHRYALAFVFAGSAGTVSPEVRSGSAGVAGLRVTASKNPLSRSIGIGKKVVELFSEEISVTVCR